MKKNLLFLSCLLATCALCSCSSRDNADTAAIMERILSNRHSVRQFSDTPVSAELMLKVLWAGNGINRKDGRRTAPSAINAQDVELYLCDTAVYHYNPQTRELEKQADVDIRPTIAAQNAFILDKPVILLCSDQTKFKRGPRPGAAPASDRDDAPHPGHMPATGPQGMPPQGVDQQHAPAHTRQEDGISRFSGLDVGIVSQNISLYCTAAGLGTVPCAPQINADEVQKALGLPATMIPLLYHPIGYPAD